MRDRPGHFRIRTARRLSTACACSCAVLLGGASPPATHGATHGATQVTVQITDLRNSRGVVRACMTSNPARFPKCRGDDAAHTRVVNAGTAVQVIFTAVKPGRYAIALLHDENNNGKADRALMMMPTEGFGFSRDAKVKMGPPKFQDAAFDVARTEQRQSITMRYML